MSTSLSPSPRRPVLTSHNSSGDTTSAASEEAAPVPPPSSQTLPRKIGKILQQGKGGPKASNGIVGGLAGLNEIDSIGQASGAQGGADRSPRQEDGPWRISVAVDESQAGRKDAGRIVVYGSTLTHNYTLLRTIQEVQELHEKLLAHTPTPKLPSLPSAPSSAVDYQSTIRAAPPSRRRSFLNAFSRFGSESSSKLTGVLSPPTSPSLINPGHAGFSFHATSASSSSLRKQDAPSQAASPPPTTSKASTELPTPEPTPPSSFASRFGSSAHSAVGAFGGSPKKSMDSSPLEADVNQHPHSYMAALAAYLTDISNVEHVRETKPWKRFFRVKSDDMSSVRVERKITRARSAQALNAKLSSSTSNRLSTVPSSSSSTDGVLIDNHAELPFELNGGPDDSTLTKKKSIASLLSRSNSQAKGKPMPKPSLAAAATPPSYPDDTMRSPSPISPNAADVFAHSLPSIPSHFEPNESFDPPQPPFSDLIPANNSSTESIAVAVSATPPRPASADPDKSSRKMMMRERSEGGRGIIGGSVEAGDTARRVKVAKKKKVTIEDFELLRVLGRGCAGKVLLVREKAQPNSKLMALKSIVKAHVLAHSELSHTLTEQAVLKRMSREIRNPFIVHLEFSFHDKDNLFLVMDFHPGGDLATQLARWGRFGRDRARFYAAEIVEGVQGLHAAGVIYRDLKPENILLDQAGHLILTDFGLSKEFPRASLSKPPSAHPNGELSDFDLDAETSGAGAVTPAYMNESKQQQQQQAGVPMTDRERRDWAPVGGGQYDKTSTFCGTAEYLAPEVIQGHAYSYNVDWWSMGTMLYEMLIGITPFWAQNHTDMYTRVLHDELVFPDERPVDQDTKSLIRGLLQQDPALRLCEPRIKKHPYFQMIDWDHVYHKRYIPPYIPPTDPSNEADTQNFDDAFLDLVPTVATEDEEGNSEGLAAKPSAGNLAAAAAHRADDGVGLFDGYSYRERDAASILLEEEEEEAAMAEENGWEDSAGDVARSSLLLEGEGIHEPASLEPMTVGMQEENRSLKLHDPVFRSTVDPIFLEALEAEDHPSHLRDSSSNRSTSTVNDDSVSSGPPSTTSSNGSFNSSPALHSSSLTSAPQATKEPANSPNGTSHRPRERSGIPSLDRDLDTDLSSETDQDDDDWHVIAKPRHSHQQEKNGSRTTLFARGVVDRYRLGVLKKKESRSSLSAGGLLKDNRGGSGSNAPRSPSGLSASLSNLGESASPSKGLSFKPSKFKVRPRPQTSHSQQTLKTLASLSPSKGFSSPLKGSPSLPPPKATSGHGMSASLSLPANLSPTTTSSYQSPPLTSPSRPTLASNPFASLPTSYPSSPVSSSPQKAYSYLPARASSVSPTKFSGSSWVASHATSTASEESGEGSSSASPTTSGGGGLGKERIKKFRQAGSEKIAGIFGGGKLGGSSSAH